MTKAERTRQSIIEKTAPIFNAKGFAGTSLNDMITATGLTKGSIYGNFVNKDDVALAVFDYNYGKVASHIKNQVHLQNTAIEKLLVYPQTFRNFLKLPFLQAGCPVLNTSTEADDTHPLLREKAINALGVWQKYMEKLINRGIQNNEIKEDTNANHFAAITMSLIEGAVMQAKVTGKTTVLNITMDHLETMILNLKK